MALLDDLRREVRQRGERIARAGAVQMQGVLRQDTPRVIGNLAKKTTVRVTSVGEVIVVEAVADTDYAEPAILGSRAHQITINPKDRPSRSGRAGRGMLRFPKGKGGVFVFKKEVWHPGTKPHPYWLRDLNRWGTYLQQAADRLR